MREFTGYKKGINLGGWLSQCNDHYNEEHYSTFIQEEDIKKIASYGVDHVRLPIDYNVLETEDGTFIESGFAHVDDCISWCQKYQLKMIFDIHKARGYVFDDANYVGFFEDKALQDQFVELWKEIIRRYGKYKDMIVFELLNEVTEFRFAKPWNEIAARTIREIRKIDTDVRIMVGGIYNSSIYGLTLLDKPVDENIVFTFHCYSPMIFTHQNAGWIASMPKGYQLSYPGTLGQYREESHKAFGTDFDGEFIGEDVEELSDKFFDRLFQQAIQKAEEYDVPLYCGEYGVIDQTNPEDQLVWYQHIHKAFEKYDLARAAWSYKKMDFGISDARLDCIRTELIKNL